ncbi:unnamed protein product [Notodromas monacha]|uniref:Uncharacterized protein n=1 Tax=Notodromas monacha TaxID=399045 RepID=A0A7R9BD69_9CRUS|nr:unnamed protein product [Notodromas monacha]CAG0912488.1 unnamed protein product [Notodromas monacha]
MGLASTSEYPVVFPTLEKWDLVMYGTETKPSNLPDERPKIQPEIVNNGLPSDVSQFDIGDSRQTHGRPTSPESTDEPYGDFRFPDPPHNPSEFAGQIDSGASCWRPGAALVFTLRIAAWLLAR